MSQPPTTSPRPRSGALPALFWIAILQAAFFAPAISSSDQFAFRDNGRMHIPVKRYLAQELRSGHFPEWNPYLGMGAPVVAGAIDAIQHPFNLLLIALPFDLAFKLWILLCYPVAALGVFLWARRFGRSWHASFAAGVAFGLSGFLVSSSDNVTYLTGTAALPWIFAAVHAWLDRGGAKGLALIAAASGFAAAGGDPQSWGFAVALLPPYALMIHHGQGRRAVVRLRRGLGAVTAALVGAAPIILPILGWMGSSSRGEPFNWIEYHRWNFHPLRIIELLVPHLFKVQAGSLYNPVYTAYAGNEWSTIPWVLSVYLGVTLIALAAVGARERPARRLLLGALILLWMSMGWNGGFGQLAQRLPILVNFRYWEKLIVWPTLLVSVAAAFGFDRLLGARVIARRLLGLTAAAGATSLVLAAILNFYPETTVRLLRPAPENVESARLLVANLGEGLLETGMICAAVALVALLIDRERVPRLVPVLLVLVVVLDVASANFRGYTLSAGALSWARSRFAEFLHRQPGQTRIATPFALAPERFPGLNLCDASWLWGRLTLSTPWNVEERISNFEPYSGMLPGRTNRYFRRAGLLHMLPGAGIWGVAYTVVPVKLENGPGVNLFPPYQVASHDPALPAYLVRVPHRERVYLATELEQVDEPRALEFVLDDRSVATARTVIEGQTPGDFAPPVGDAHIVRDEPTRVEVEIRSDRRALLVLNDVYADGWSATVDRRTVPILPANYLARGVWVENGTHRVTFSYRTPLWREGWLILAAGALALGGTALRRRLRSCRESHVREKAKPDVL